jgi:hypothetical protein
MPTAAKKTPAPIPEPAAKRSVFFRLIRNHLVSWVDGEQRFPDVRFVEKKLDSYLRPTGLEHPIPEGDDWSRRAVVPQFDMDKVFEMSFDDLTPVVPEKSKYDNEAYYAELVREAFASTKAARNLAKLKVAQLKQLRDSGVIEIVDDPSNLLTDPAVAASAAQLEALKAARTA